jgi:hypothetical protein
MLLRRILNVFYQWLDVFKRVQADLMAFHDKS